MVGAVEVRLSFQEEEQLYRPPSQTGTGYPLEESARPYTSSEYLHDLDPVHRFKAVFLKSIHLPFRKRL